MKIGLSALPCNECGCSDKVIKTFVKELKTENHLANNYEVRNIKIRTILDLVKYTQ